jgi:glutathione peroxidase
VTIFDVQINSLNGDPVDLARFRGQAMLVVNVASQCGMTPQYAALQHLSEAYADRGLVVLGVPCNQFGNQEPGSEQEIAQFCETNYGVTFAMTEKVQVNGDDRHPLYAELVHVADARGHSGDVRWNFEKFLVAPDGQVVARFHPRVAPDAPEVTTAVEKVLPR